MTLSIGPVAVLVTWITHRSWLAYRLGGSWFGPDFNRGTGWLYGRLLGLEVSVTWGRQ